MSKRADRRAAERLTRKSEKTTQPDTAKDIMADAYTASAEFDASLALDPFAGLVGPLPDRPISELQFIANRANAQLTRGPVTAAGKAISSRNHTTHGLTVSLDPGAPFQVLPNEDQAAFDRSLAGYAAECKPVTTIEHNLVNRLAIHSWLTNRARNLQNTLYFAADGHIRVEDLRQFEIFGRYETTHQRAFNKAFTDLMRYRNFQRRELKDAALLEKRAEDARATAQIRFESQKRKSAEHAVRMEILHLRLEAQKQRNQRVKKPVTALTAAVSVPEAALETAA